MTDEALFFLKALKEDGVDYLCVPQKNAPSAEKETGQRPSSATQADKKSKGTVSAKKAAGSPASGAMLELREKVLACKQCAALVRNRTRIVFGAGNINAKLVFVGEAPGRDEDQQGIPFVGRAGQLLTKIIEAMGLTRQEVFICNVLKCRPPENRPPAPDEVVNCRPFLKRQLELIKPRIIVALGNHACQALLSTDKGISQLRGSLQEYEGIPVMCTYHPAYLLRNPAEKKKVWEDMKKVIQLLNTPDV